MCGGVSLVLISDYEERQRMEATRYGYLAATGMGEREQLARRQKIGKEASGDMILILIEYTIKLKAARIRGDSEGGGGKQHHRHHSAGWP